MSGGGGGGEKTSGGSGRSLQIDKLLETVVRDRASDLHISCGQPPALRAGGRLVRLETKVLTPEDTTNLMKSITPERNQQELQERGGTDFGFAFGDKARFRVAVFKQRGMISMVLRRIPNEFLTFEQLGLPAVVRDLIQRPRGLFLVTGPTGSGKTTSLASMINWMNHNMDHHIITLEDPIEYYHEHKHSMINQREIGVDVPSFPEALKRALRMDPDVILVGEMRDLETISAAITAAETGHVVFGTLHTTGAQWFFTPGTWKGFDYDAMAASIRDRASGEPFTIADGYRDLPEGDPAMLPAPPTDPDAVRWLYSTSGTTSQPKAVMHTDATLIAGGTGLAMALDPKPDEIAALTYPYAHIGGPDFLVMMLRTGLPALLMESFTPADAYPLFRAHGVTMYGGSTAHYLALVNEVARQTAEVEPTDSCATQLAIATTQNYSCKPAYHKERNKNESYHHAPD